MREVHFLSGALALLLRGAGRSSTGRRCGTSVGCGGAGCVGRVEVEGLGAESLRRRGRVGW